MQPAATISRPGHELEAQPCDGLLELLRVMEMPRCTDEIEDVRFRRGRVDEEDVSVLAGVAMGVLRVLGLLEDTIS